MSAPFRALALVTEAFGGYGGIALYNRDLLTALCAHPDCREVVLLPRLMPQACEPLPTGLTQVTTALGGKGNFVRATLRQLMQGKRFDLVVCGHLNLLPLARLASRLSGAPLILEIYGIDAWHRPGVLSGAVLGGVDAVISISRITTERFRGWASRLRAQVTLLPNAIHLERYGAGPKPPHLLERYGLTGKQVIMTLGRLNTRERYKGFDEVMGVLPGLAAELPHVTYLIAGEGDDRPRLEQVARERGVADRVVFTGMVPEEEKADHFRLADAYVMPSSGEGFGFVFLEAMACGIPVVASRIDGSRDAVRDGLLGALVDPRDPAELHRATREALARPRGVIPAGLEYFSTRNFTARLHQLVDEVMGTRGSGTAGGRA